ncbi:MAG TPA: hypothetical protein VFX86_01085 [Candidatus Saccharimonadales bacterium]|nr:hypothetical protein [Candidatus Saccharimonadales bacterium]
MTEFDRNKWGVSFSIKQCRNFSLSPDDVLKWLIDIGFRRFRLMSYWDEHENEKGKLDFKSLDEQIAIINKVGGKISLCLGVRQPRWPENHWPAWALKLEQQQRGQAIYKYIEAIARRYKDNPALENYQLENEALLKSFGKNSDVDRKRLRSEFKLVKQLDPNKKIIMTTSTSWGIPLRRPIPDIVGFSFYQVMFNNRKNKYTLSFHKPWLDKLRAGLVKVIWRKRSFIHELQLEPWGPRAIWEMGRAEQDKSMDVSQIRKNIRLASSTSLSPIDLWGGEWWYWRMFTKNDSMIWQTVQKEIAMN